MAHPNKRKGTRFERQVCHLALEVGFDQAERTWGSDGRSRGLHKEVDVVLTRHGKDYHVQCKNEETVPEYIFDLDGGDARTWVESSTGQEYTCMPLRLLMEHMCATNTTSLTFGQPKSRARLGGGLKPSDDVHLQAVTRNRKPALAIFASRDLPFLINNN